MGQFGGPLNNGKKAAEALSKHRFVNLLASDTSQVEYPDAQADHDYAYGITEHDAAVDEHVTIRTHGPYKLTASAAIALGALIAPTALGKGVTATTGNIPRARALEAAAAAGDVIEVTLIDQQASA